MSLRSEENDELRRVLLAPLLCPDDETTEVALNLYMRNLPMVIRTMRELIKESNLPKQTVAVLQAVDILAAKAVSEHLRRKDECE